MHIAFKNLITILMFRKETMLNQMAITLCLFNS